MKIKILLVLALFNNNIFSQFNSDYKFEQAIQKSITDFSKTRLYKKDNVFHIWYKRLNDSIILVDIIASNDKYLYSKSKPIYENKLPSRYYEQNEKIFLWWNDSIIVNEELFDRLKKYDLLQDDEGGWIKFIEQNINDKQKGAKYFFCINNLDYYKRVITNLGIVKTPIIKCK